MIAVKENKEIKILDIQKEKYLEAGYTILNDNLGIVEKPFNKKEKEIEKLEKENQELKTKIKELEKENEELKTEKEQTITQIKAKLDELEIKYDKKANKEQLMALLPQE